MPFTFAMHGKMMNHRKLMSKEDSLTLFNKLHGLDIEDVYSDCKKLKGTQ